MLDLTIASDILALTKPHISQYSCFSFLLTIEAGRRCATTASIPGIQSVQYTVGVKERLRSRQGQRYLSFFSFSASPPFPGPFQKSGAVKIPHLNRQFACQTEQRITTSRSHGPIHLSMTHQALLPILLHPIRPDLHNLPLLPALQPLYYHPIQSYY